LSCQCAEALWAGSFGFGIIRHHDDCIRLSNPDWLQARKLTLYHNGVQANVVVWDRWVINGAVDEAVFAPPQVRPGAPANLNPAEQNSR
jgi:hypothetical protein